MNAEPSSPTTSPSLVARVRAREAAAWAQFASVYGPLVYHWARKAGLQDSDASDVMQEVFRSIASAIDQFRGDTSGESFRGWLWSITSNQVRLLFRRRGPVAEGGSEIAEQMKEIPFEDLTSPDDSDSQRLLVRRALALVREDFSSPTWEAFERLTIFEHPTEEVAADLNMTPRAVRQAKYRVLARLRQTLSES